AEVVLVDQMPNSVHGQVSGEDLALVEIEAQKIAKERNAFRADLEVVMSLREICSQELVEFKGNKRGIIVNIKREAPFEEIQEKI
ncbi:hypothetical protein ACTPD5_22305, partial [Clostridioides difficile]